MSLDRRVQEAVAVGRFEERLHPRARDGEFASKPGARAKALSKRVERAVAHRARVETLKSGGVTISVKGDTPHEGYAFAPDASEAGYEQVIPKAEFTEDVIADYMQRHDELLKVEGNYLGAWESSGQVYLDISRVGPATADTLAEAVAAKQLAAYDLASGREIALGHREGSMYVSDWKKAAWTGKPSLS